MTPKEIMKKAIDTYGANNQIDIAIEEMSELIKALLKHRRVINENPFKWNDEAFKKRVAAEENVCEEIADVEIMLEQLKIIYHCHDLVDTVKNYKLNRLKSRLEKNNETTGSN